MQDWVVARKNATPHKTAFVCGEERISFYDFNLLVQEVDIYIQTHAFIKPGEAAAVLMPTSLRAVAVIFALMRKHVVYVPLNTRLTASELKWQIKNAGCKYVLCCRETEQQAASLADSAYRILSFDKAATDVVESMAWISPHVYDDDGLIDPVELDVPFAIIHTSGTSGRPKGAVLTCGNFFYSAMVSAYRLGTLPDDCWLCVLPLYHVGGLSILIRAVLYGIAVDLHPHFDLDSVNHALDTQPITLISLVPTMLHRLLDSRTHWPESLRLILLGGAAASPELLARCHAIGLLVAPTYGLTEAASQVATILPSDSVRKSGSLGKPLLFTNIRIVSENDESAAPGEYGEIVVTGPTVMQGYYNDPDATAETLRNGELHTGDIGYLDDEGDLWVVQRRSDLIVSGGENVYPAEVEQVLRQHPAVADVCVIGLEGTVWGQQVAAAVVLREGAALMQDELIAYGRAHLAGYKLPRRMVFVDALPQTASGKIARAAVVNLFMDVIE